MDRKSITFEQAEGLDPLPAQLRTKQVSATLRARLWRIFYTAMRQDGRNRAPFPNLIELGLWRYVILEFRIERKGEVVGEFSSTLADGERLFGPFFQTDNYAKVLGTTEWLLRKLNDNDISEQVAETLISERSAYRLIDGNSIVPLASEAEGQVLLNALSATKEAGLSGARSHLLVASRSLSQGRYADCVRESIHALESVARSLTGGEKFSDALASLEKVHPMHSALRRGLTALYGYSSDEQGIRHPLLDGGDAKVSEADAILMLGICASAVTFFTMSAEGTANQR